MFSVFRYTLVLALLLPVQLTAHRSAYALPSAEVSTVAHAEDGLGSPLIVSPLLLNQATGQLPVIRLSINGSAPLYFLFDTGSGESLQLASWASEEIRRKSGVPKLTSVQVAVVGKNDKSVPLAETQEVGLLPNGFVQAFKSIKLAGIIGTNLARKYTVCLDPAAQTMTLYNPTAQPVQVNGAAVVPLLRSTLVQGSYFRDVEVTFPGAGAKRMQLDTGSSNVVIPLSEAGLVDNFRISSQTVTLTTVYGTKTGFAALLPQLTVGSRKETDTPAVVVRDSSLCPLLGMGFLSRFKTTLDFAHDRMLLEPTKDYAKRSRINGDVGLKLAAENGKLSISFVDGQGAAFKAGLRPKDQIETIDGIDVTTMSAPAATQLLPQRIGASSVLRVRPASGSGKDNKPVAVTLTAEDPFLPVSKTLGFGFSLSGGMRTEFGKPIFFVSTLSPGSGAAEAGLRVGDEFLSMGNKPTSGMNTDEVVGYLKDPAETTSLPVTVRREGVKDPVSLTLKPKIQSTLDALPWPQETASEATAQDAVKPVTVPFQYDPPKSRLLTIRARVNGSPPLLFLVNTDLRNDFVLFSWALPETGVKLLPAKDQPAGTGPGDRWPKITSPCQLRPEVATGSVDATINEDYAIVVDELPVVRDYPEGRIAGIVGGSFLTSINSVIDFDKKTIFWYSRIPSAADDVRTAVLPLKKVPSNPTGLYVEGMLASDKNPKGTPVAFLLDTGSTNSFLPETLAGAGAGKENAGEPVVRRLTLGGIGLGDVPMDIRASTSEPTLGLDVLSRFRVTIDKAKNEIRLSPRR